MIILHITETLTSGVLKYLQEVTSIEQNSDNQHYILFSRREFTPTDVKNLFNPKVNLIEDNIKLRKALDCILLIKRYINNINPDIIHLHSSIAGVLGRISASFFPKAKVYYTPHGYSFLMSHKPMYKRVSFWIAEFLLTQMKGNVVACSKSEFRHAKKLCPFRRVFLVENCIAPKKTCSDMKMLQKQIIGVGRIEEQKNPKLFVRIAAAIKRIDPHIRAVWIGDGTLREECKKLNKSLDADVSFTGWISNEETIKYLEQSSIFVQTSKWEGLPYSVLEAISIGLPIVASNISSHKDLIGGNYEGFIAKNEAEFIFYIMELIKNPELMNSITINNKNKLQTNYNEFFKQIRSLYSGKL